MLGYERTKFTVKLTAGRVKISQKGGIFVLSSKEVMRLEDVLGMEQTSVNALNHFANTIQDNQSKQLFQQLAQKNQQHFQTLCKHLNAGQSLQ